jgi:hypothetical protein
MSRAPVRLRLISLLAAVLWAAPLGAASRFDPALRFRTLATEHFVIYFHRGEERIATRLAAIAEETYRTLQAPLGAPLQKRTHVVLVDQGDLANGWAYPLPYNTIMVTASWPPGSEFIGHTDDWLRLVFTHEFVHIVHLDRSGGWAKVVRRLFGRTPLAFPNLLLPLWQIEGLATYEESVVTGTGRLAAGDFRSIEREAARARALEPIDRVNGGLTSWPNGLAPYAYGLGFHEYLAATYGAETLAALADRTARSLPFLGAHAFGRVYGKSLGTLWDEYQDGLIASSAAAPSSSPEPARVTRHGFTVVGPRFLPALSGVEGPSPCASCPVEIVYSVRTPHGFPALNAVHLDGSGSRQIATRYLGSTIGVGVDVLVFDQQELHRTVGLYSDLYALDRSSGSVRRLTSGARLLDPDLSPDGTTIVAVREGLGKRDLVTVRLKPDTTTVKETKTDVETLISEPDTQFNAPRWSPDGRSIAVERHRLDGTSEVVIVVAASGAVRVIASDPAIRFVTPAWRPDGQALVAAAARHGEPFNLYELDVVPSSAGARQLTATTGGATWPDVSPDGSTIVYVGYTIDGFDLFTIPYPTLNVGPTFRSDAAANDDARAKARAYIGDTSTNSDGQSMLRSYTPLPTLAPTSWEPLIETGGDQLRIGGAISGVDVLGYHAYAASATWLVDRPAIAAPVTRARPDWEVAYAYDRWQPTLFLSASKDTSFARVDDAGGIVSVVSHQLEAGILVPFRRVRISHQALAAVVRTVDDYGFPDASVALNRTAARAGWATSSARFYGFSVSPEHGVTGGATAEIMPEALGANAAASALTGDFRAYLPGARQHHVAALRVAGGVATGEPTIRRTFVLGGSASNPSVLDFDSDAFSLLRGFEANAFAGSRIAVMNAEYRWPLARPERGFRTWPVFLHTVHAALFADAGHTWSRQFRAQDVKASAGAELSADLVVGYSLRMTLTAGGAWGRDGARGGNDAATAYVRIGRAF